MVKFKVEAHVTPWVAPQKVNFDEGLELPIACVPKDVIKHLCRKWLDDVCAQSDMTTFEVVFDIMDEEAPTPAQGDE